MVGLPSSPKKDTPVPVFTTSTSASTLRTVLGSAGAVSEPSVSTGGKSTQVARPEASRASMGCPDVAIVRSGFGIRTCRFVAFFVLPRERRLRRRGHSRQPLFLSRSSLSVYGIGQRRASEMNQIKGV
jgi:hypothetical protein